MAALVVVGILRANKFALQVASISEGHAVELLSPDCPDEPFHKRVQNSYVRHGLHFCYLEYAKIDVPPVEPAQGIIITADIFARTSSIDRLVGHPVQVWSSTRESIHDDEHPVAFWKKGFAAEQIDVPQTIFGMSEHC